MSILLAVGVVTTVTILYLGKKGWQVLHKAVGITPGVLTYTNPNAQLSLPDMTWQKLALDRQHLTVLPDEQLRQLQRIDNKVAIYQNYQQDLQAQNMIPALTEQEFVLHKLLHTRLPEMLTSHYRLRNANSHTNTTITVNDSLDISHMNNMKINEARQILQQALDNIEKRLDTGLEYMDTQHLQDLRIMKSYIDSHNV